MMLSPLVQAGATELSVAGRYRGGGDGGDGASVELPLSRRWSILLTFEKVNSERPQLRSLKGLGTPCERPLLGPWWARHSRLAVKQCPRAGEPIKG